jgi:hypothetical protein
MYRCIVHMKRIWIPFLVSIFFLACDGPVVQEEHSQIWNATKEREIVIVDESNQLNLIWQGLQTDEVNGIAYGIDFRTNLAFGFSLEDGKLKYIGSKGRGPEEMLQPVQITLSDYKNMYIYDSSLDLISHAVDFEIIDKRPGFLRHDVWLRHTYGYYYEGKIYTSIEDPSSIQSRNFNEAKPIAALDLESGSLTKHGAVSPTIYKGDSFDKYPVLAFDPREHYLYYVFFDDYSVMRYCLRGDTTSVVGSFVPGSFRIRSMDVDFNRSESYSREFSNRLMLNRSELIGLVVVDDMLIVIWQNVTQAYISNRNPQNLHFFGVIYSLNDYQVLGEITLPGKLLGTYDGMLLIEEDDDPMNYTIGFYSVQQPKRY